MIHLLIFSIPVAMVIEPQSDEMELFVSKEEVQVLPEPVKKPMVVKKPRPEPAKELVQPIEPSPQKIKPPKIIEPVKEVAKEPEIIEPVQEVLKAPLETEQKPVMLETTSQPATETRPPLFVPPVPKIPLKNSDGPAEGRGIDTQSDLEHQPPVSHHTVGTETQAPIKTRFGASISPAFLHRVMPVNPMMARRLGQEGKVVLKLTIGEKGMLREIEVVEKAGYGFTEAAVEAVKKSTFLPAKKDGKPIASRALLPITFQLESN